MTDNVSHETVPAPVVILWPKYTRGHYAVMFGVDETDVVFRYPAGTHGPGRPERNEDDAHDDAVDSALEQAHLEQTETT